MIGLLIVICREQENLNLIQPGILEPIQVVDSLLGQLQLHPRMWNCNCEVVNSLVNLISHLELAVNLNLIQVKHLHGAQIINLIKQHK